MKVGDNVIGLGTNQSYDVTKKDWTGVVSRIITDELIEVIGPSRSFQDEKFEVNPIHFAILKEDNFDKLYLRLK